ncbi:NAD(P)-dependent oxidoreductase [Phycicoccus endophyticus]|uniref:NAD(P)-dependent oxidoreductase n=1 Tax=Phycicoccus endophyticus TaxID=1690220 RepID=A0A7G9QZC3_9MICO|nr:NAD(P)-dependent oxidoreductase [Phycicoccus endophyticus]NHI19053.1 NAD(P)-dependent oxidoreductase [Phycicoccus endophyticus]QNN48698.1 NAD(P)-dependent oxidoreductase [Phycicoccus endophyticus]GGL32502.1 oxidoreductase [Phycicoccus endophyticus]
MADAHRLAPGDVVGFVGLGNMGEPMVRRLLGGGFRVDGYDVDAAHGAGLADLEGFRRAESLEALARDAAAVVLMLPNSAVVEQVLLAGGLLEAMASAGHDAVLVDMGSSQPRETVRMHAAAAERGVPLVDAPVSGGVPAAREGTLAVMVGGSEELFERVRPALELIGSHVGLVGGIGAGHALKAINNLLSASTLVASAEAMTIGKAFGLTPETMMDVINESSGRSWSTLTKWPRYIIPGNYDSGFAMALLLKDIRIAAGLAEDLGVAAPHADLTVELYRRALEELPPDADHTDIHRWVEQRAGSGTS